MADRPKDASSTAPDAPADSIDRATFDQILEMDDDDERDFSRSIVFGFFDQAESTFKKMDTALKDEDLETLSSLGHFLKGSSATLGLTRVKNSCEKIQHLGNKMDESGSAKLDASTCLEAIRKEVEVLKREYKDVEAWLRAFFAD